MDNKSYNKAIDDVVALLRSERDGFAAEMVKHCELPISPAWVAKHNRLIDQDNEVFMLMIRIREMYVGRPETILPDTPINLEIQRHE